MTELHRILVLYLLNSLWQVPLLYLAARLAIRPLSLSSHALQHRIWLTALISSVAIPLLSAEGSFAALLQHTFLPTHPVAQHVQDSILSATARTEITFSTSHPAFTSLTLANFLLLAWAAWIFFRALQLTLAYRRIRTITRRAQPVPTTLIHNPCHYKVLSSNGISVPATTGILNPTILLPSTLADVASTRELAAVLAHESAHIARHDFTKNLFYELLAIPLSFNPALRAIFANIAHTRELICDSTAAHHTGDSIAYARALVTLSELLLQTPTSTAPALGLFDGRPLENRIMSLLNPAPRPSLAALATGALLSLTIFAPCCVAAASYTLQPSTLIAPDLQPYAGTWHWMFKGKPFVTMELVPAGGHFTGYMTNGFFSNDADGNMIDAGSHPGRSAIIRTFFSGNTLHIVVQDNDDKSLAEWTMTLTDVNTAQFNVADPTAPKNMKPWTAQRVSN